MVYKIYQVVFALSCWREYLNNERMDTFYSIHWLEDRLENLFGDILFISILLFGILVGEIRIPLYLGDGYSYDNFS